MTRRLTVGTRASPLARAQTARVVAALARRHPKVRVETVPVVPSGDRNLRPGTSPDFTDALDRALLKGDLDLAVHSAKDLPATLDPRLELAAIPERADPRDALVVRPDLARATLPRASRVGSSSPRRRAQLLRWRPDLEVVEVRGNVGRRLGLIVSGEVHAVVLAVAGLVRLRKRRAISRILPRASFLPAPAQGALAVVARSDSPEVLALLASIDRPSARACVLAERTVARTLEADCGMPLAALARQNGARLELEAEVLSPDGRRTVRTRARGPSTEGVELGTKVGSRLRSLGARELGAGGS